MKKVITILITLALILSLPATAFAAGGLQSFVDILEHSLAANLEEDQYEVKTCGRVAVYSLCLPDAVMVVNAAKLGDATAVSTWDKLKSQMLEQQKNIQNSLDSLDNTYLFLANCLDRDTHTLLLSVLEGEIIYDAVNTSDPANDRPLVTATPAPQTDGMTVGQKNAVKSAESYLEYSSFSRHGLIEQLEFEGFSHDDAVFAVDHITVDWNEQAAKSAESYLKYSSFSRQGLIEQLEFEGFTHDQAVYGVEKVGY